LPTSVHSALDGTCLRTLRSPELVLFRSNSGSARHLCQSIWHRAQMKLVTVWRKRSILPPEYVPGKCNIGRRGRAIRLTTGLVLIVVSIVIGLTILKPVNHLLSLALVVH